MLPLLQPSAFSFNHAPYLSYSDSGFKIQCHFGLIGCLILARGTHELFFFTSNHQNLFFSQSEMTSVASRVYRMYLVSLFWAKKSCKKSLYLFMMAGLHGKKKSKGLSLNSVYLGRKLELLSPFITVCKNSCLIVNITCFVFL